MFFLLEPPLFSFERLVSRPVTSTNNSNNRYYLMTEQEQLIQFGRKIGLVVLVLDTKEGSFLYELQG